MHQYGFSFDNLTPNVVDKIVGFKMACRALGVLPQIWAFKYNFNSVTQYCVYKRYGVYAFIIIQKAPKKNW